MQDKLTDVPQVVILPHDDILNPAALCNLTAAGKKDYQRLRTVLKVYFINTQNHLLFHLLFHWTFEKLHTR